MAGALQQPVSINKSAKPFGDLTRADVRARADQLAESVGWGPTAKVGPVARAWKDLADHMEEAQAATVADVADRAEQMAQDLWVIPPGGSLL